MVEGYLRQGLWRRVYLLEFYKGDTSGIPEETFAFGVPPESEEITLGMRKSETKTFGGLVVDDYGCDNAVKISFTGSSVNNELRKIYNPHGASKYLTGEEEIYTFKAFLEKCKRKENLNGKMLMYDLSKHDKSHKKRNNITETFCWQVFPGELKIKRSKEKPFTYTYSIDFTAIPNSKSITIPEKEKIVSFEDKLDRLFYIVDKKLWTNLRKSQTVMQGALDKINRLRQMVKASKEFIKALVNGAINEIKKTLSLAMDISNATVSLWHETVGAIVPFIMELADYAALQLLDIMKQIAVTGSNIKSMATKEFYLPKNTFDSMELIKEQFIEALELFADEAYRETVHLSLLAKNILPNELEIKEEEDERQKQKKQEEEEKYNFNVKTQSMDYTSNEDDEEKHNTIIYGADVELITDGMSFESIAIANYGDVNKAELIANINNASSIDELIREGHKEVIVPRLEKRVTNTDSVIIGFAGQRDNYGVDIALDEKGNMSFNNRGDDFKLVEGKDNLSQAILNRLKESVNKRVRLQYYGIKVTFPDEPAVSNAYILSSIIQTLKMEARIKEILGISFREDADALRIDIDYTDIGGQLNTLQGVV